MTIRVANGRDEPQIQAMVQSVYEEYDFGWEPDGYIQDIYDLESHYQGSNRFWVAEQDDRIIACIGVKIFDPLSGPRGEVIGRGQNAHIGRADCELVRLYAHADARGKGVGRALCNTCIEYARSRGRKLMQIWSDTGLVLSHPLYRKLGAVQVGQRTWYPPDGWTEYGFILEL